MPFAPNSKLKDEQQQGNNFNVSGGAGASFASVVPGQEKKSSGQYANLQQYISANQDQAGEMGQKVSANVSQAGQDAESKVNQLGTQKQNVAAFDPNQYIQNAPSLTAEQKQTYKSTKETGGYTGPQQLEQAQGYTEAQKAAQSATDKAKMAGTESGQQELLRQTYARPNYSQGETKLDQVLLGGNAQAKQGLSDLSQKYSGLYDLFNKQAQDVGTSINQANAQALANRQAIAAAEPQAWNDLVNPIKQRAQDLTNQNIAANTRVQNDLQDDLLFQDTLDKLGLTSGQNLYDLNLNSYITPNQTQLGVNDVANQQEREKYQALRDLFGDQTRQELGLQGAGISLDPYTVDYQRLASDLQQRQQGLTAELAKPAVGIHPDLQAQFGEQPLSFYKDLLPQLEDSLNSKMAKYGDSNDIFSGIPQLKYSINNIKSQLNNVNAGYNYNRRVGVQNG